MISKQDCWIQTYTGKQFFPFNPKPEDIDLIDVAVSLGKQCRYNGHTINGHYSVAEHSLRVCEFLEKIEEPTNNIIWGLLHDAAETYITDMAAPLKPFFPEFIALENTIQKCIAEKFNLSWPMPKIVKWADHYFGVAESVKVMKTPHPAPWNLANEITFPVNSIVFQQWHWRKATKEFLNKCAYFGIIINDDLQKISV